MTVTVTEKPYKPAKNDRVVFRPECARPQDIGKVFTVDRFLKVNIELVPEGGGKRLRCHPSMLAPAPAAGQPAATAEFIPYEPPLHFGQVVKMKTRPGLFVVIRETNGKYSLARLGGDEGRYWRGVGRRAITPVTVTTIETADA